MGLSGRFDPDRHPRGYAGRFAGKVGSSPPSHAMRGPVRPGPSPLKRSHAVTPIPSAMFAGAITVRGGFVPYGD